MSVLNTALIMLFLNHRIIVLPAAAYLMPLTVIKQLFFLTADLIKTFIKPCQEIKRIRPDRHVHMESRLFKLLGIHILYNRVRSSRPALIIISNLSYAQPASDRKK